MEILRQPTPIPVFIIWGSSFLLHAGFFSAVQFIPKREPVVYQKVIVNVTEKPKPVEVAPAEPEPRPTETPKPQPKPQAQEKKTPVAPKDNSPPPQPVMGLSKESFAEGGKGSFSAPAGNTTMAPDEGKRLSPEEIRKLDRDLSADAELVEGSFVIPAYTPEAEDNALEGAFIVDVYIDTSGKVLEVELRKKIGYGMDERVVNAMKNARFRPRKNPLGQPLAGWKEQKIRLTLQQ